MNLVMIYRGGNPLPLLINTLSFGKVAWSTITTVMVFVYQRIIDSPDFCSDRRIYPPGTQPRDHDRERCASWASKHYMLTQTLPVLLVLLG